MSLFSELQRRNVFRVGVAYVVAAWLIIQVAETIFPLYGFGDTPARTAVTLLAIGFPLFLVFSWVFEITPEGLRRETEIDRGVPISGKTGKRLDRVIIVLLGLALGYFAFDKFILDPAREARLVKATAEQARSEALVESFGEKSIAVLPFVNLSADPEQEYFSDGISEELLNLLAQVPELRVISRSSSFYYKGKDVKLADIARELNVAHVLEGSVRKSGNRVRITAQLIDARGDTHLWSETYDRELDDVFTIQDEISAAIVGTLKARLGLNAEAAPRSVAATSADAYVAYLEGREMVRNRERERMADAVDHLERAVRLDGNFAPAHGELAIAIMLTKGPIEQRIEAAMPHLERAQELDPDLAEAHGGRALAANMTGDWPTVIEHARKALASNPNYVDAMHWLRNGLTNIGHYEEANALLEKMLAIDPLSASARAAYANWLANRGRTGEAHAVADQILAKSPFNGYGIHALISQWREGKLADSLSYALRIRHFAALYAFIWVGEYDEARRFDADETNRFEGIMKGRWDAVVRAARERLEEHPNSSFVIEWVASTYHFAGRFSEALPLYERLWDLAPEGRPIGGWWPLTVTMRLALTRRMTGDEAGAQEAAEVVRHEFAAMRAAGYDNIEMDLTEAMLAAFEHDPEHAIASLQTAVRRGLLIPVYFKEPIFDPLKDDPRFVSLRGEMETMLAVEHEKILQLICFDNPVPEEWQPLPETCDGVEEQREL